MNFVIVVYVLYILSYRKIKTTLIPYNYQPKTSSLNNNFSNNNNHTTTLKQQPQKY